MSGTRYILMLFVVVLYCPGSAWAQSNLYEESPFSFYGGFVAGANLTQVDGDDIAGYNKAGLNVGGIMYAKFSKNFALSMEILYSQKGSRLTGAVTMPSGITFTDCRVNLNYAEVPVMINLIDKHKSNFGVGLSYSRLASSTEYIATQPGQPFDMNAYPFSKDDLNIIAGGNLHLWKGLFFNIRFQYSLRSIRDNNPPQYDSPAQYNRLWVLRMMYLFM